MHWMVTWSTTTEQLEPGNTSELAAVGVAHALTAVVLPAGPKLFCKGGVRRQGLHLEQSALPPQVHTRTQTGAMMLAGVAGRTPGK